jgi:hypothetical protein
VIHSRPINELLLLKNLQFFQATPTCENTAYAIVMEAVVLSTIAHHTVILLTTELLTVATDFKGNFSIFIIQT